MHTTILDEIDKVILNMLLENGRVSYTDIAKAVDMKPPSVIDRIKKMESEGIIKQYTTKLDYKKLGHDLNAFVGVVVDNPDHIAALEETCKNIDTGIVSCYHVTGEFTIILKVITENTDTLSSIVKKLRALDGVTKTNTIIIFSTTMEKMREI
jgi:Lrp/AsnC family leucine-responsive transcriptional regulator